MTLCKRQCGTAPLRNVFYTFQLQPSPNSHDWYITVVTEGVRLPGPPMTDADVRQAANDNMPCRSVSSVKLLLDLSSQGTTCGIDCKFPDIHVAPFHSHRFAA